MGSIHISSQPSCARDASLTGARLQCVTHARLGVSQVAPVPLRQLEVIPVLTPADNWIEWHHALRDAAASLDRLGDAFMIIVRFVPRLAETEVHYVYRIKGQHITIFEGTCNM